MILTNVVKNYRTHYHECCKQRVYNFYLITLQRNKRKRIENLIKTLSGKTENQQRRHKTATFLFSLNRLHGIRVRTQTKFSAGLTVFVEIYEKVNSTGKVSSARKRQPSSPPTPPPSQFTQVRQLKNCKKKKKILIEIVL